MHASTWRRIHTLLGLGPLGGYLLFHAWEHWPVRASRQALAERVERTSGGPGAVIVELCVFVLPLAAHALLGARLRRVEDPARGYGSPGLRRLQAASGAAAGLFLLWHLWVAWLPRWWGASPVAGFQALARQLDHLPAAFAYLLGLTALSVHLGQGVAAALRRLAPGLLDRARFRLGAGLGALVWLVWFNLLAGYVAGAGLW